MYPLGKMRFRVENKGKKIWLFNPIKKNCHGTWRKLKICTIKLNVWHPTLETGRIISSDWRDEKLVKLLKAFEAKKEKIYIIKREKSFELFFVETLEVSWDRSYSFRLITPIEIELLIFFVKVCSLIAAWWLSNWWKIDRVLSNTVEIRLWIRTQFLKKILYFSLCWRVCRCKELKM